MCRRQAATSTRRYSSASTASRPGCSHDHHDRPAHTAPRQQSTRIQRAPAGRPDTRTAPRFPGERLADAGVASWIDRVPAYLNHVVGPTCWGEHADWGSSNPPQVQTAPGILPHARARRQPATRRPRWAYLAGDSATWSSNSGLGRSDSGTKPQLSIWARSCSAASILSELDTHMA